MSKAIQKIEVGTKNITDLFKSSNKTCYAVPFFQRGYVWEKRQWQKMYDDMNKEIFNNSIDDIGQTDVKNKRLFFGTIVLKNKNSGSLSSNMSLFNIIDGQQRLITCYIFLATLYHKLRELQAKYQGGDSASSYSEALYNAEDDQNNFNKLKIISTQGDTLSLYKILFQDDAPTLLNGQLERERQLKRDNIEKMNVFWKNKIKDATQDSVLKWMDAILHSLELACIYLPDEFDEQVIFETLNAAGVELTTSELLCNYIFSKMKDTSEEERSETHYKKWLMPQKRLEQTRREAKNSEDYSKFESYLRYLFSIGQQKMIPKGRAVYHWFKREYQSTKDVSEQFDIIHDRIQYFQFYIHPRFCLYPRLSEDFNEHIQKIIADISNIGVHLVIPFVITLLHERRSDSIADTDVIRMLSIIRVMLIRNRVMGSNPKYDVFFPRLFKKLQAESKDLPKALSALIKEGGFHVTDDEFRRALSEKRIYYDRDKKLAYYVLQSLDRHMSAHGQTIEYANFPQIEHVLPQKDKNALSDRWKKTIGQDIEDENFDTLKHSIGNLTIIGAGNQHLGDKHIDEKVVDKAYGSVGARPPLTQNIIDLYKKEKVWNLTTIQKRSAQLAKCACEFWNWHLADDA